MKFPVDGIIAQLDQHQARKIPGRRSLMRSAVSVVMFENEQQDTELLLMQRAQRQGDPWSGHISFPGGRMETQDAHPLATAKRELHEEMGIDISNAADFVGRSSDVVTRQHAKTAPMIVSPYLFRCHQRPEINANHEAVHTFWMPLSYIANQDNRDSMTWQLGGKNFGVPLKMPCYFYQEKRVWGLTLLMLDELVKIASGKGNSKRHA